MTTAALSTSRASFYAPVADLPREDVLHAYKGFLEQRDGDLSAPAGGFPKREAWLKEAAAWPVLREGTVDAAAFERGFARPGAVAGLSAEALALLAFVKMNAGEAYGVEVLTRRRHTHRAVHGIFEEVERLLATEETYHTKILLGATRQFGVEPPRSAFRPPLSLKLVIGTLAYAPKALFHPILLGAEIGGVYSFNWMLQKVGEVFRGQPALRELMERRMLEILIDEVGHIAFNRMAVGPTGLAVARALAGGVVRATNGRNPEFLALGWSDETARGVDGFDLDQLPEEVRRLAFFA